MTTIADAAAEWAHLQVGAPYQERGTGNPGFDCSGLVEQAYAVASKGKIVLPHNAAQQRELIHRLDEFQTGTVHGPGPQPELVVGDPVFYYGTGPWHNDPSHVAIYIGKWRDTKGKMRYWVAQATNYQRGVEVITMRAYAEPTGYGRVLRAQHAL